MEKEQIDLEQENSRHTKQKQMCSMCSMCQMCPCMQQSANMMGMYQEQMKQPMMGDSNGRNEYEDEDDFDEDDSRGPKHYYGYHPYMYNPYFHGVHGHYCPHCGHYHR